jgi:hypothetical protein
MKYFSDKTKAIIALQERGYDQDFVLKEEYIECAQCSKCIEADDFEIDETYQFDTDSQLKDKCIIYAIRAIHNDLRGILMTSYSTILQEISSRLRGKLGAVLDYG